MENTYTYTARSALAPEKVVTFTLYDHRVSVDLAAPLEQIEEALAGEEPEQEPDSEAQQETQSYYALKPTVVSLLERGTRPFDIADVRAQAENGGLAVTAWVRAKGLRLVPVRFAWEQVDNPEGARAFAKEVRARRRGAAHPGSFAGLMDYWVSWLLFGMLVLFLFWPQRQREDEETEST
jgi:hypothetical protein